jgi:hypothetical protein
MVERLSFLRKLSFTESPECGTILMPEFISSIQKMSRIKILFIAVFRKILPVKKWGLKVNPI